MPSLNCPRVIKCLAVAGLGLAGAADTARAGFTTVKPAHQAELGHAAILSRAYGGSFAASGVNFGNGSVTAERLDDVTSAGASATDLLASGAVAGVGSDQCWTNGVVSARAVARFGGFEQTFGFVQDRGPDGRAYSELFTVTGYGTEVGGSAMNVDLCGKIVELSRGGGGEFFTSMELQNAGATDQMVSYKLTGLGGGTRYVLFFEDAAAYQNADFDFNDMVIELTAGAPNAVPLPPAAWTGLAVLTTGGMLANRRRLAALLR